MFHFPWETDELHESRALRHIAQQNDWILEHQEKLMATVDDLTGALAQTNTDLQTLIGQTAGGITPAQLDPILSSINDLDTTIKNAFPQQ